MCIIQDPFGKIRIHYRYIRQRIVDECWKGWDRKKKERGLEDQRYKRVKFETPAPQKLVRPLSWSQ